MKMAIPTYDELMVPVLKVLSDGSEHSGDDITNIIADQLNLTEEERNRIYSNNPKKIFKDRVAWARTYLKKAGLIESPQRSTSKITREGMKVVKSKLKDLNLKFLEQYESYREFRHIEVSDNSISEKETVETVQTPDEMLDYVRNSYKENLQSDILTKLKKIDPIRFEQVVLTLMEKMNYGVGSMTKMSHDGGIDGIINEDELGLEKIYLQANRYSDNKVNEKEIQNFAGALSCSPVRKGVFITTSYFDEKAKKKAEDASKKGLIIRLINGDELTNLMIKHNIGIQIKDIIEIKKIDEDFFIE
jgi:restriction system protein